jgi:alanine racemase
MLYGIPPEGNDLPQLQPVMTFNSRVFAVRAVQPGEPLGYGATYIAKRPMRIGLVCAGYADGYPQTAPSGTPIAVDGRRTSLVGRVSMDMLMTDLTDLPETGLNSEVELWGRTIRVSDIASASSRIPYELVCNVRRAPIVHRDVASTDSEQEIEPRSTLNHGVCAG